MSSFKTLKIYWQAYGCKSRDFSTSLYEFVCSDLPFILGILNSLYFYANENVKCNSNEQQ